MRCPLKKGISIKNVEKKGKIFLLRTIIKFKLKNTVTNILRLLNSRCPLALVPHHKEIRSGSRGVFFYSAECAPHGRSSVRGTSLITFDESVLLLKVATNTKGC